MYAVRIAGLLFLLVSLFLLKYARNNGNWVILITALVCLAAGVVLITIWKVNRRK